MKTLRIPLRVVFYKVEPHWVAHCLEFDLCGHGPSKEKAMGSLDEAITLQVRDSIDSNNPNNLFSPADSEYFRMFAAGRDVLEGELNLKFSEVDAHIILGDTQAREYSESDLVEA